MSSEVAWVGQLARPGQPLATKARTGSWECYDINSKNYLVHWLVIYITPLAPMGRP